MNEKVGERKIELVPALDTVQVLGIIVSRMPHLLLWQHRSWWTAAWGMETERVTKI